MLRYTYLVSLVLIRAQPSRAESVWEPYGDIAHETDSHCPADGDCGLSADANEFGLSLLQHRAQVLQRSSSYQQQWEQAMASLKSQSAEMTTSKSQLAVRAIRNGIGNTLAVYSSCGISHPFFVAVSATVFVLLVFGVFTAWFTRPSEQMWEPDSATDFRDARKEVQDHTSCGSLRWYHLAVLMGISLMDNFSTDFYVPNMPAIASELATDSFMIGLSLQINLCMRGVSSLALGVLSDSIGRVRCVILATVIYTAATIFAMFSTNITAFLAARALQGVGEGVIFVCDAIVRDAFPDARKRIQTLAIMGTLAPLAVVGAPMLGGVIGAMFGWRFVFGALALNGLILTILAAAFLPETRSRPTKSRSEQIPISSRFSRVVLSLPSMGLLLTLTLLTSNIFSMLSNIATVLQGRFGMGVVASSLLIGLIPSANIVACGVIDFIGNRFPPLSTVRLAMASQMVPCVLLLGTAYWMRGTFYNGSIAHTMSVFWCMIFANGLCFPGLSTLYLEPFSDMAGFASGINGLCQSLLGAWIPALATAVTVFGDVPGLQAFLGATVLVASCIFWASFGAVPPLWMNQPSAPTPAKEVE